MPGLTDLIRNPRRLQQFAATPGNFPAALNFAAQDRMAVRPSTRARQASQEEDEGVLETGEVIDKVRLPDGSYVRPPTESGQVVKMPGKSNLFVDPATGEPYQADPTKPGGLRSAYESAKKVAKGGKLFAVVPGIGERELGPDPEAQKKAEEQAAKRQAEDLRLSFAREKRPYNMDRVTGRPVPLQSDEEWAKIKQEKADKLAQDAHTKKLRTQAERLDLEADRLSLTAPKVSTEEAAAYDSATEALRAFAEGKDPDQAAQELAALPDSEDEEKNAARATAQSYLSLRDKVKPAKDAEAKAKELKLRALDLKEQMLDPDAWKAGKTASLAELPDEDLAAEAKAQADIITEQEEEANATLAAITKDRNAIVEKLNAFQAERQAAEARGLSLEERQALDDQRVQLETELADFDDWNSEALSTAQGSLKASQDRREVLAAADAEVNRRAQTAQEAAKQASSRAAVLAKGRDLYEGWGKDLYTDDWRAESTFDARLEQEAKKAGLSVPEAKEALQTFRQLDWSNAKRDPKTGETIEEKARVLPDGNITVNPSLLLDPQGYDAAVDESETTPEAKARAKAMRQELAAPVAAEAIANLRKNSDFAAWLDENTTGSDVERMEQFNAEMKAGGALNAALMKFFGSTASLPSGWLGAVAGLTGSDKALEYARYWQDRSQAYQTAAGEAGKGTNMAGRFMASVAGGLPSVMESLAVGGVAGRVLGAGAAALGAAAVDAAAQSGGGTFVDAVDSYMQQGMSQEEAKAKAATPAIASALTTGVLTALGGGGVESLLRPSGQALARSAIKRGIMAQIGEGVGEEAAEEWTDQMLQGIIAQVTYDPNKPLEQVFAEATEAGLVGGVLGGGASGLRGYMTRNEQPPAPGMAPEAGPSPSPAPEGPAPAQPAAPPPSGDVAGAIKAFTPTGTELMPQAITDTVKRTNRPVADVARAATSGLVKVAKGASLESLDAREREALGFINKDGKIVPAPKTTPLVEIYKDNLVIRNEAAEWLDDEGQPVLARQIKLDEAERKAQIDEAAAKPTKKKAGQATPKAAESTPQAGEVVITSDSLSEVIGANPVPATTPPAVNQAEVAAQAEADRVAAEQDAAQRKLDEEAKAQAEAAERQARFEAMKAKQSPAPAQTKAFTANQNAEQGLLYEQSEAGQRTQTTEETTAHANELADTLQPGDIVESEGSRFQVMVSKNGTRTLELIDDSGKSLGEVLSLTSPERTNGVGSILQARGNSSKALNVIERGRIIRVAAIPEPAPQAAPEPELAVGGRLTQAQVAKATPAQKARAARKKAQAQPASQVTARQAEAQAAAKTYASAKEWANSLPKSDADAKAAYESVQTETPYQGVFKEGELSADSYGNDPYIYRNEFVNPEIFRDILKLEGLTYEQVVQMPSTQRYIQWYKEGKQPPPIDVVIRQADSRKYANNRRRVVAALEAGIQAIPARVEIGRASEVWPGYQPAPVDEAAAQAATSPANATPEPSEAPSQPEASQETASPAEAKPPEQMTPEEWAKANPINDPLDPNKSAQRNDVILEQEYPRSRGGVKWKEKGISFGFQEHAHQVQLALNEGKPVSAIAVSNYLPKFNGIILPAGYVREGDLYVYRPEAAEPAPASQEQASQPPASQETASQPEAQPATPLARAQAALAAYQAKAVEAKKAATSQKDKNTANRQIVGAKHLAEQLAKLEGAVEYEIATAFKGAPIPSMMVIPAGKGGLLAINPAGMLDSIASNNLDAKAITKAIDKFIVHELIHKAALGRLSDARILDLYNALTPAAKEASRKLYLAQAGAKPPPLDEFQAAHEWFAQLVEARMTGEISNQALIEASDDAGFRDRLIALLRDFVAQLRDIAGLVKDKAMAEQIRAEADAVQAAAEAMAAKAGLAVGKQEAEPAPETPVDPNIGREWDSVYGRQRIVSRDDRGLGSYLAQTVGTDTVRHYSIQTIDDEIRRQEYALTPEYAAEQEERKARAERQAQAEQAQEEAKAKAAEQVNAYFDDIGLNPMQRGKLKVALDQFAARRSSGTGKEYSGPRYTVTEQMVADGFLPQTEQVPAMKEPSGTQWNRMDNRQQQEFERKRKAAGMKTEYRLALPDGSMFEVTKAEHDYAKWLAAKAGLQVKAEEAGQAVSQPGQAVSSQPEPSPAQAAPTAGEAEAPALPPAQAAAVSKEEAMPEPAKQAAPFDAAAAKGQKKFLLAEVAAAVKAAPRRAEMTQKQKDTINLLESLPNELERASTKAESDSVRLRLAATKADAERLIGYVTIEVPGDGTFTILNEKGALAQFQKRADKFPVSAIRDDMPAKPTAQAPTAVPALKKPKTTADVVAAIYPMVSEDTTRGEVITKVMGDGTHLFATDGRVLVRVEQENGGGKGREIALYDEKGVARPAPENERLPDIQAVIPDDKDFTPYTLDTGRWFSLMSQARAVLKTLPGEDDSIYKSVQLYRNPDGSLGVFASDPNRGDYAHNIQPEAKFLASYNPEYVQTILRVARNLGQEQIELRIQDDITPATFRAGPALFVLMPMRVSGAPAYSPQVQAARPTPPVTAQARPATTPSQEVQAPAEAPASQEPAPAAGPAKVEPEDKPPVGYGDEPAPPPITAPGVRYNDIPLELARQAHRGTSFLPDVRARGEQRQYVAYMNDVWEAVSKQADTDEKKAIAKEQFETYRTRFLEKEKDLLRSRAGLISAMITGPARFPVARAEKRSQAFHNKLKEFLAWDKKAKSAMLGKITPQSSGIISADDPDAPEQIQARIDELKARQEMMKKGNEAIRKNAGNKTAMASALRDLGVPEAEITRVLNPPQGYGLGWQSFTLTNNNANIRRNEERLERVQKMRSRPALQATFEGGRVEENTEANRVQIFFDAIPAADIRAKLKSNGFKWAPSQGAWQRQRTSAAVQAAEGILGVKLAEKPAKPVQAEESEVGPATPQPLPADEGGQAGLGSPPVGEWDAPLYSKLPEGPVSLELYHGTWRGGYDSFRPDTHFSRSRQYAERYMNPSASSLGMSGSKTATDQRVYKTKVDFKKVFDTRHAKARKLFNSEFFQKYGTGTPIGERGLPDWTDGIDLAEWLQENHPEYDGIVLDEGAEPVDGKIRVRPESYIPLASAKITIQDSFPAKPSQPGLANPPGRPGQEAASDEAQAAELEEAANEAVREAQDVQETSDMMDQIRKDAEAADALRNDPDAVAAVQASGAMSGRNLSQQFQNPAAREFYRALTAARDMVGGPPTVVFAEMRKWAAQQVQADPDKAIAFASELADDKAMMRPEEQAVVGAVIEHLNRVVAMTGDKATRILLHRLGNYYLDIGTLTAQALAGRRDPLETPQDRWNKALTVIFGPDSKVRRRLALAPTAAAKARRIAELEAQLAGYQAGRRADIEAALREISGQETQEQILERSDAANEKLKADILKRVGIMEQDMTLSTEDRYSLQTAILELPAVREALDKYDNGRDIMRLAFQGRSDAHIAGALQIPEAEVRRFIAEARDSILRPAIAAEVKAGKGWGEMIRSGFDSLARRVGLRMAAVSGPLNTLSPPMTQQQQQEIERKVSEMLKYVLQPGSRRNKAGGLIAKVIQTPSGQKVRVFVPFDPEDMASFYAVAREFSAAKASVTDKLYEYWINWPLLSGPQTQVANLTGNAANVLWHYTAQRMVEAGMNVLYRDPNSAKLSEFKHVAKAFMGSIMPALDMARQSFLTEGDSVRHKYLGEPMEIEFKDGSLDKVGAYRPSIGGKAGQLARLPGRLLRFTDAFFKTSILHMEATAIAYRAAAFKAKQQGLTGKNRDAFMEAEMANALANPGSQIWQDANKTAEELLFQDDNAATDLVDTILGGNRGVRDLEKLMAEAEAKGDNSEAAKLRNRIFWRKVWGKIMRVIFPFQRTPTNIIKVGLRKAGGSAVVGLWHAARAGLYSIRDGEAFLKNYPKAMQIKDVSESLLAGLGWMMLASMFEGDDDDEKKPVLIVGSRPYSPGSQGEREAFNRSMGGTNSIIFRDKDGKVATTFNFSRYEPVATLLSAWVDGYRNYKEVNRRRKQGEADASYLRFIGSSLLASVEGKSFLQGFSGMMEFMRDIEERRATTDTNWTAKQFINGVVPNLIKQPLRNWDDLIRDTKTAGIGYTGLPNPEVAPKLPVFAAEPKITTTGERIRKGYSPPARLLFQANAVVKPQPDALLLRANRLNPVAAWYPQPLQADDYYVRQPGAKRGTPGYKTPITDPAAKRRFAELEGRLYADAARKIAATTTQAEKDRPTVSLIEAHKKAREEARAKARVMGGMIGLQKPTTKAITTDNK